MIPVAGVIVIRDELPAECRPTAHVWPEHFAFGDPCHCGEYYLLKDDAGDLMLVHRPAISICSREQCFADDVLGVCARCQAAVYVRPHTAALALERVCLPCYLRARQAGDTIAITPETLAELLLYYAPAKSDVSDPVYPNVRCPKHPDGEAAPGFAVCHHVAEGAPVARYEAPTADELGAVLCGACAVRCDVETLTASDLILACRHCVRDLPQLEGEP